MTASAGTFPPLPRRPRCTKSPSIISSTARGTTTRATRSTSRGTPRPACTPGRFSKAGSTEAAPGSISARSWPKAAGCRRYPHPWLMPSFWEFPTVSMGLGPIMAIYQARFNNYLQDRGIDRTNGQHVWAFLGDGETDEPETLGRDHAGRARKARQPDLRHQLQPAAARWPGARQRQDHSRAGRHLPRRRLERDQGHLGRRLGTRCWPRTSTACSSSAWAKSSTASIRSTPSCPASTFASTSSASIRSCRRMVRALSDEELKKLRRGGHDPEKVYAAYKAAVEMQGQADRDPGQDDQGLRPGRRRRRPQRHAPAEEAGRKGAARVPQPLRHSDFGRRSEQGAVLSARRRQRGNAISQAAPRGAGRLRARSASDQAGAQRNAADRRLQGVPRRQRRPRSLDHDGLRRLF